MKNNYYIVSQIMTFMADDDNQGLELFLREQAEKQGLAVISKKNIEEEIRNITAECLSSGQDAKGLVTAVLGVFGLEVEDTTPDSPLANYSTISGVR